MQNDYYYIYEELENENNAELLVPWYIVEGRKEGQQLDGEIITK